MTSFSGLTPFVVFRDLVSYRWGVDEGHLGAYISQHARKVVELRTGYKYDCLPLSWASLATPGRRHEADVNVTDLLRHLATDIF